MSDQAGSEFTNTIVRQAGEIEDSLSERLKSNLPEVINPDGLVDWKEVGKLELVRESGSVVLAHAIPELMFDYAKVVGDLEKAGRTDEALSVFELSRSIKDAALNVLGRASTELYSNEPDQPGAVVHRRNGETTTRGETLIELGDVLTLRMQEDRITPDKQDAFFDDQVKPVLDLVRSGFAPAVSMQAVDLSRQYNFAADELVITANQYGVDLADEAARALFAIALERVDSLDDLVRFSDGHGGLNADVLESISEIYTVEAEDQAEVIDEDGDLDDEEETATSEELASMLSEDEEDDEESEAEREARELEEAGIRALLESLDKPTGRSGS